MASLAEVTRQKLCRATGVKTPVGFGAPVGSQVGSPVGSVVAEGSVGSVVGSTVSVVVGPSDAVGVAVTTGLAARLTLRISCDPGADAVTFADPGLSR